MESIKLKDWNPSDRPREKLLEKGIAALTDAELIAILLRSGTRSETVVEVAKRVLALCNNNLNELGKLERTQLQKIKGIGNTKAITLIAALELGRRRSVTESNPRTIIHSAKDVVAIMAPSLVDLPHEEMWLLLLNRANRVMETLKISQGGVNATIFDNRLILKPAIEKLASGIILVHNHPSGNVQPSADDKQITAKLKTAASFFDIALLDHIIITDGNYYSFAEKNEL